MSSFGPELPLALPLDDRPGPAARLSRDRSAALVEAALLEFDHAPEPAAGRRFAVWRSLAIAAGVLLALAGAAAAARFVFDFGRPAASAPAALAPPPAAANHAALPPEAEPETQLTAEPIERPIAEPLEEATPLPAAGRANRAAPDDLLQRANHMRAAGQFREAARTYGQVYERFPRSLSAYVARVAGAAIELEHLSNPTRARRLFEQALREQPAGALDLEARQGLSVALRDLEDRPAEVRALQALIAAHPDSPAARRAQVRLRELGAADR
jgi:tetratricopeptide (TPR) repeat protein